MDAQRIHNLTTYLQELHSLGLANSDHTTLLLNTYTKLKDVARLDSFIKGESKRASEGEKDELPFDLDTAIRVCRQAGYFEHASYLAKKYERHEDYLRIQIEDAGNFKDALTYLRRLGADAAESNLARYGRAMLANLPEETTQLLIDICTSLAPLSLSLDAEEQQPENGAPNRHTNTGPSYLSYLALNRGGAGSTIAPSENVPASSASAVTVRPGDPTAATRRDSLLQQEPTNSGTSTPPPSTPTVVSSPSKIRIAPVKRPSPRLYFAHFIDHRVYFLKFLETVALKRWGQSVEGIQVNVEQDPNADEQAEKRDQEAVWNTLLELYLTSSSSTSISAEKETGATQDKAMRLLRSSLPYDPTHALILCSTRGYTPGLVLLWERMGMHEDVLRFHIARARAGEASASSEVLRLLDVYGPTRPKLYLLVLRFLTESEDVMKRHGGEVGRIMRRAEEEGVLSPLGAVQLLSRNGVTSIGLVKDWLLERITQAREEIETVSIRLLPFFFITVAPLRLFLPYYHISVSFVIVLFVFVLR